MATPLLVVGELPSIPRQRLPKHGTGVGVLSVHVKNDSEP
jgi:hypothetical protein